MEVLKTAVHAACMRILAERIRVAEAAIADLQADLGSETKSSAGDKHETARAMAHIELEKHVSALAQLRQAEAFLERIDPTISNVSAGPGALLRTDGGVFYIAVALGRITVGNEDIWAISPEAPLLHALKQTPVGGVSDFNGKTYRLLGIG